MVLVFPISSNSRRQFGRGGRHSPSNNRELTLAAAWKFSRQGKRSLIFCTQRDHVESYAEAVVDLHRGGFLPGLLEDITQVERAAAVGGEWLGPDHPAVKCLAIGVAIHHGRLPAPFLRQIESLLSSGVLRVTVASPTLAQGLNLNAAVLLIPTLYRAGVPLSGEEFANVAGRAGRAFVDLEGLVLHVMYKPEQWRMREWRNLVRILQGAFSYKRNYFNRLGGNRPPRADGGLRACGATEYLANSQEAWFPADTEDDDETIASLIERLDTTVLGLVEALDSDSADLSRLLDEALTSSLWARQIVRLDATLRGHQLWLLQARARLIWNKATAAQRRGSFAMGVGLEAGLAVDAIFTDLSTLLDRAEHAALSGNLDALECIHYGISGTNVCNSPVRAGCRVAD